MKNARPPPEGRAFKFHGIGSEYTVRVPSITGSRWDAVCPPSMS